MQYTPENAQKVGDALPIDQIICGDNLELIQKLCPTMKKSQVNFSLFDSPQRCLAQSGTITIENIVNLLQYHFFSDYGVTGASWLPVLGVYSMYKTLMVIERYNSKTLSPLKSRTPSDIKSGGIGDIEVFDEEGNFFEAVEIKHNIPISPELVQDAYQKFFETSVSRYYLLTTAEPNVDDPKAVNQVVRKIHRQHGCEVIVDGVLPSLKYYLRSLSDPKLFLYVYSKNLQLDFNRNRDVKEIHLRRWNELLEPLF